jgi:signal transduction histidine kinase
MKCVLKGIIKLVEISQKPLILNEFSISDMIEKTIKSCSKNCEYHIEKITIKADIDLMQLVITNLIENAVKFSRTKDHPIIIFGSFTTQNELVYYLNDNGIGFDPIKSEEIFKPFKRAHNKKYEGSGLGLSIANRIIQHHGGKILATSTSNGATFFFTLPQISQSNKNIVTTKVNKHEILNELITI